MYPWKKDAAGMAVDMDLDGIVFANNTVIASVGKDVDETSTLVTLARPRAT
jgi:hypothetical protein